MESLKVIFEIFIGFLILRVVWAFTGKPFVIGNILGSVARERRLSPSAIIFGIINAFLIIGLITFVLFAFILHKTDPSHTTGIRGDSEEEIISTLKKANYAVKYDGLVTMKHPEAEAIVPGAKRYVAIQKDGKLKVYFYFDTTGLIGNYGTRYK